MIQHFQFEPLFESNQLPGWSFSFYYLQQKISGLYQPDGKIEWAENYPGLAEKESDIKKQIHELMLYHVYDQR